MTKIIVFILLNFYTTQLRANIDNRPQLEKSFKETIVDGEIEYLEGSNRHKIAFKKLAYPKSSKSIVFVHGTGENFQRYINVAKFFYFEGFNVYLYDQRGHGYSGRFTDSSIKIHTDSFERQVEDLSFMVNMAVEGLKDHEVYILAHSMGGLIALRYLELFPDAVSKAVITSPMLKMETPFPETMAYYIATVACSIGKCTQWVMGQHPDKLKDASYLEIKETHNEKLHLEYVKAVEADPVNRKTWGVTYGWFKDAMDLVYKTRDDQEIKKINTDFLILTATDDQFVDVPIQKEFCDKTSRCRQINYEGSWHNLLQENDEYRLKAFREITDFFYK